MLSDGWLSRYGLLENFNASVTRTGTGTHTGTGTWTTGVTAIALCTSCSRAKNAHFYLKRPKYMLTAFSLQYFICIANEKEAILKSCEVVCKKCH